MRSLGKWLYLERSLPVWHTGCNTGYLKLLFSIHSSDTCTDLHQKKKREEELKIPIESE